MISLRRCRVLIVLAMSLAAGTRPTYAQWHVNGATVCNAASEQISPSMIADGAGGAIVAWVDYRTNGYPNNADIFAQHVLASGAMDPAWPANGTALCNTAGDQYVPTVVSDGAGGAIVAWSDHRSGTNWDIYAQHVLASGSVDPAWPVNGTVVSNATGDQFDQKIIPDGTGGAIITWMDRRSGPHTDIYAQHLQASGVVDAAWPPNGIVVCSAAGFQESPQIISDGPAGAIIAWEDSRSNVSIDVYAQHVLNSGVVDPAWPLNGAVVCNAPDNQNGPAMISDGAGGAIVTWREDYRGSPGNDVYVQHVLASGLVDPAWTVNGTLVCNASDYQANPAIVADGSGGAILAWRDFRSGATLDIYAQHVLASGLVDPYWTPNGTLICDAAEAQDLPLLVGDGAGGAFLTWIDYRNGSADIYAHHLLASGTVDPALPVNGSALCSAPHSQGNPKIISDGAGGAIGAWADGRTAIDQDIYVQRIYASGGVAAVSSEMPSHLSVHAPHPNPSHHETLIEFDLRSTTRVSVGVYDVSGQRIRTLAVDRELPAGRQSLVWNGDHDSGVPARTGIYFIQVTAEGAAATRRVAILR